MTAPRLIHLNYTDLNYLLSIPLITCPDLQLTRAKFTTKQTLDDYSQSNKLRASYP